MRLIETHGKALEMDNSPGLARPLRSQKSMGSALLLAAAILLAGSQDGAAQTEKSRIETLGGWHGVFAWINDNCANIRVKAATMRGRDDTRRRYRNAGGWRQATYEHSYRRNYTEEEKLAQQFGREKLCKVKAHSALSEQSWGKHIEPRRAPLESAPILGR